MREFRAGFHVAAVDLGRVFGGFLEADDSIGIKITLVSYDKTDSPLKSILFDLIVPEIKFVKRVLICDIKKDQGPARVAVEIGPQRSVFVLPRCIHDIDL